MELLGAFPMESGSSTFDRVVARNVRPQICFVVITASVSSAGIRTRTPFNLLHANVSRAQMVFESERKPDPPYTPHFPVAPTDLTYSTTVELYELYTALGVFNRDAQLPDINQHAFRWGTTVLPFVFNNETSASTMSPDTAPGNLSLSLRLRSAATEPLNVYLLAVYQNSLYLHMDGSIVQNV